MKICTTNASTKSLTMKSLILTFGCTGALCLPLKIRSEEHTSELQSRGHLVCRLLLEKKKHDQHAHDVNLVEDFKKRFYISIKVTIPILLLSQNVQGFMVFEWRG